MEVINEIAPSNPSQMEEMMKPGPEGPIFMINLLKYKDKAEYADGRETDLTGKEAYQIYANGVVEVIREFGGHFFFKSDITFLPLGQVEELWDEMAIAVYPDRGALVRMSMSEAWQNLAVHRMAGLKGQLNMESVMPDRLKELPWMAMFLKGFEQ